MVKAGEVAMDAAMVIRPATSDEFAEVGELTARAYLTDGLLEGAEDYQAVLRDAAGRAEHGELLVATDENGRLLGTVTVFRAGNPWVEIAQEDEWEFRALAVDPSARGRGVARALVEEVMRRARQGGARRLVLCTQDRMIAAQRLYESLGFVRMPERDQRPTPQIALLAFGRDLVTPEIRVRIAEMRDLAAVADLTASVFVDEGYLSQAVEPMLRDTARRVREAEVLVAVDEEDQALGTLTLCRKGSPYARVAQEGELEIRLLAVTPGGRRRGVGEALVRAALDRARDIRAERVVLTLQPRMTVARRLAERMGFRRTPERDWETSSAQPRITYTLEMGE